MGLKAIHKIKQVLKLPPIEKIIYAPQIERTQNVQKLKTLSFDAYHDQWIHIATASPQEIIKKYKDNKKMEKIKYLDIKQDKEKNPIIKSNLISLKTQDILEWSRRLNSNDITS